MAPANVFTCRRCGRCCQGEGGIVLGGRDIERLGRYLGLARETLLSRYAQQVGAMPRLDPEAMPNHHVLIISHAGVDARDFVLPPIARDIPWRLFVDTAAFSPADVYPGLDGPPPAPNGVIPVEPRSLVCYVAPDLR